MARNVRVVAVKRKQVDTEKVALAFILLAKSLQADKPDIDWDEVGDAAQAAGTDTREAA